MENFPNYINNKLVPATQYFLIILPELDKSFKLRNKIYIDNKLIIDSLIYKILTRKNKKIKK